ncbi:MAG: DnaJ domain-containing protein [Alphaproteobacteria bacterium]|nr:DnaJ domain-containing protein [Alphaproteobacteria bacterium]MBU1552594.1 DnaJ domain-containing protein [Alphaproteobacteria bacterium]MBU2339375.1 DnaJ domain-containing protein [Alphaproteobacteria bacterium]MBU2390087.1 DnaJ domain-containing protein [Alphaproteobacteria bacterium]
MRDPYSVLGVQRTADADEIKSAWRSKAKSIHPDHNQDDPTATSRFAEVGRAYDVLKDPERRRRYDRAADAHQTILQQRQAAREAAERAAASKANAEKVMEELARANAQRAQAQATAKAQAKADAGAAGEPAEDMVERIFGAAGDPKAKTAGAAPGASSGAQQKASQTAPNAGAGAEVGEQPSAEDNAKPDADVEPQPLAVQAVDLIASLVRRIRGVPSGPEKAPDHSVVAVATLDDLLKLNWLTITLPEDREVRLPLEAGMTDGHTARLKGQGLKVQGMQRGDLLVTMRIKPDSRFRVDGFDLHTVLPISLEDAVLGTERDVETPEGVRSVTIPAWSGSDRTIALEGLGLHNDEGGRGSFIVEIRVLLHEKPDEKITDLMRHMREGLYI